MSPAEIETVQPLPLAWDKDCLVVTDPAARASVRRTRLSASTAKSMDGCPARYVGEKLLTGEVDPFGAAELGSSAHTVMELVMQLPSDQRTKAMAASFLPALADAIDFTKIASDYPSEILRAKWIAAVISKYEGLWDIEDPSKVLVRRTEMSINNVEIGGVPFVGFIDRCDIVTTEDGIGVKVVDYKGLALDTLLPTPTGWTTMGEVAVGDLLLGAAGNAITVLEKSGIHERPCYRIVLDDGSAVVCDNVHLWNVAVIGESTKALPESKTVDTDTLAALVAGLDTDFDPQRVVIADPDPVELPEVSLPVDPWMAGCEAAAEAEPLAKTAYLRASLAQRVALVQGLMDTGGSYNASRRVASFTTTSLDLARELREVLVTLGVSATFTTRTTTRTTHRVEFRPARFNPFCDSPNATAAEKALSTAATGYRTVVAVEAVQTVPTQCVVVDAPDSLYLCGPTMVATHNSGKYKAANDRFGDDHGDQIRLYVEALEAQDGRSPVEGHLYYTGVGRGRKVSLRPVDRRRTVRKFVDAWDKLTSYQDANAYPARSQTLCGWCPLVNACPVAARDGHGPRIEGLPDKETLGIGVLAPLGGVDVDFDIDIFARDADLSPPHPAEREPEPFIIPDSDMLRSDHYEDFDDLPELPQLEPQWPQAEPAAPADLDTLATDPSTVAEPESGRRSDSGGIEVSEGRKTSPAPSQGVDPRPQAALITSDTEHRRHDDMTIIEGKPWDATGPNGEFNPNSYAATAAYGLVEFAVETLFEAGIALKMSLVTSLARTYTHIVETCQSQVTGSTSMQDGTNTRMRGALRTTVKTLPPPFGSTEEAWAEWVDKAIRRTSAISNAAIALWSEGPGDSPWTALAVRDASATG